MFTFKRLNLLHSFIKELIFDGKNESIFSHHEFNPRKFTIFLIIIGMFSLIMFLTNRVIHLGIKVQRLEQNHVELVNGCDYRKTNQNIHVVPYYFYKLPNQKRKTYEI